jgi:hypothetical protein
MEDRTVRLLGITISNLDRENRSTDGQQYEQLTLVF